MLSRSLLAVVVLLVPQGTIAQNLLANPRFATDLLGWTATPAGTRWSPLDAESSGTSGSADLFATGFTGGCQVSTISQCLPATAVAYDFAGAARFGGYYDALGLAFLRGDQCTGDAIQGAGLGFSGSSAPPGTWTTFSGRAPRPPESHVMVVTANALACGCVLGHCNMTESWFDNFSLTEAPPPTPARFYTVTPCRLLDTRSGAGGAIPAQTERKLSAFGLCGIPETAKALALNVTVTDATDAGDLRVLTPGIGSPIVSTINYGPGQTRANNTIIGLGFNGELIVHSDQVLGFVHAILDVTGYFE